MEEDPNFDSPNNDIYVAGADHVSTKEGQVGLRVCQLAIDLCELVGSGCSSM